MSRSRHQRHSISRKHKQPRTVLDTCIKDGHKCITWKHIRLRPYGRKNFIGWGGEIYSKKFGYYFLNLTCKKTERRNSKKLIASELEDYNNSEEYYEALVCGNCIFFDRNCCQKHHKEVFILTPGCNNFFS